MAVIDVHTHMLTMEYLEFLDQHGGPKYEHKPTPAGQDSIWMQGAPFMTLMPEMWDYDARIRDMDKAGVDLAVVSLTCPNAFFGDEAVSVRAARMVNDPRLDQRAVRYAPGLRRCPGSPPTRLSPSLSGRRRPAPWASW